MNDSVKQDEVKQVNRRSFLKGAATVGAVAPQLALQPFTRALMEL